MADGNHYPKIEGFKEARKKVDDIINAYGGYWPPLSMLASLIEEVGEIAREINALEGYKPKKPGEPKNSLSEELGDAFFSLYCLANYYDVDMGEALSKVIEKYWKRDRSRYKSIQ